MADSKGVAAQIAARCRRIGWDVSTGGGRTKWIYRITPPGGSAPVFIHGSPSDTNWEEHVWRKLNAGGFAEAEAQWLADREEDNKRKLAEGQQAADAKTRKLAAKAAQHNAALARAAGPYAPQPADLGWLLTPTRFMETRTIIVTPAVAEKLLSPEVNVNNRKMKPRKVEYLARVIRNGEWAVLHQGGAMDTNGHLQDSQHRMAAILEADQAVPMMFTVGCPEDNKRKVDTVTPRTARDAAVMRGEQDPGNLTTVAKMLVHIGLFRSQVHIKATSCPLSNDEVDAFIEDNRDELHEAISVAKEIRRDLAKVKLSALATAVFLVRELMPEDDPRVGTFLEHLQFGPPGTTAEKQRNPVYMLRRLLTNAPEGKKGYSTWETLGYIIKGWNFWSQRREPKVLMFRPAGEPFPQVIMPPPVGDKDNGHSGSHQAAA